MMRRQAQRKRVRRHKLIEKKLRGNSFLFVAVQMLFALCCVSYYLSNEASGSVTRNPLEKTRPATMLLPAESALPSVSLNTV